MSNLYSEPIITPPVQPDNPLVEVPSDQSTPVAIPLSSNTVQQPREYVVKVARPMPHSGILEFGEWLCNEDWSSISSMSDPTKQVETFQNIIQQKLDLIFPTKSVKINPWKDLPFINADLKKFNRLMKREYRKHSKSDKYLLIEGEI